MIDFQTELGRNAERLLRSEKVVWLTTVRADGAPWPNPVWFVWDGETALVYSMPGEKVEAIARNPLVSLHFNGVGAGGDIVILSGEAGIADGEPPVSRAPAYLEKYGEMIASDLGMTVEKYEATYSVPVRITPRRLRGH